MRDKSRIVNANFAVKFRQLDNSFGMSDQGSDGNNSHSDGHVQRLGNPERF